MTFSGSTNQKILGNFCSFHFAPQHIAKNFFHAKKSRDHTELKTEEGYSADIVWTYIPRDICPHNVRTMSAQCPHNVRTTSPSWDIVRTMDIVQTLCRHISFVRCCADIVRTLCGHISLGIYVRTMSALYPSSVFRSGVCQQMSNPQGQRRRGRPTNLEKETGKRA